MRITISGPPGSGKTTTCKMLSEALGVKAVVFGQFFREMAAERKLTLGEFSALAEKDPEIDKKIDSKILEVARSNADIILESRLSAYLLSRNNIPAFKIYLSASPKTRMTRVGTREGESIDQAVKKTLERQASEAKRYKMYYDIDIDDLSVYDLVVSTDNLTPKEVTKKILESLKEFKC